MKIYTPNFTELDKLVEQGYLAKKESGDLNDDIILNLYISGKTSKEIQNIFKIPEWALYKILKKNKITKRNGQKTYTLDLNFFKTDSHFLFWYIGLMSADGSMRKSNTFTLSQSGEHGLNMIQYVKNLLSYNGNISKYKNSNGLAITNSEAKSILEYYGIINNKTLINIPKNIPIDYLKSYLRGYFEGDGSIGVYKIGGSNNFLKASFVGTHELINYIKEYIPNKYREVDIKRCKNLKEIVYSGRYAHRFLNWLYDDSELYKGKKFSIYENWLTLDHQFVRYDILKDKARLLYNQGINCMEIAKQIDVPFQTIYDWKNINFKKSIELEC